MVSFQRNLMGRLNFERKEAITGCRPIRLAFPYRTGKPPTNLITTCAIAAIIPPCATGSMGLVLSRGICDVVESCLRHLYLHMENVRKSILYYTKIYRFFRRGSSRDIVFPAFALIIFFIVQNSLTAINFLSKTSPVLSFLQDINCPWHNLRC